MKKYNLFLIFFLIFNFSFSATIKFWHSWSGEEATVLSSVIAKYESISGNKVIISGVAFDNFQSRFKGMSSRGNPPDVIVGPADWLGAFASSNLILPLNSYIPESDRRDFIKSCISSCYFNDTLYGLPESVRLLALYYNKDLISTPPATTRDMISLGLRITNEDNGVYGLVYPKESYYYHIPWLTGYGGKILDDNNRPTFNSKEQIESVKFARSLTLGHKKIMPEGDLNVDLALMMFNQNMAGMMIGGNWLLGDLKNNRRLKFGVAKLPILSDTNIPAKPIAGSDVLMISAKTPYREASLDFIQFLTSSDVQGEFVKAGHIPTRDTVYEMRKVKNSPFYEELKKFREQLDNTVPMPTAPEMNYGVWDSGNLMVQELFNTNNSFGSIVRDAQHRALKRINEPRR